MNEPEPKTLWEILAEEAEEFEGPVIDPDAVERIVMEERERERKRFQAKMDDFRDNY